MTAPAVMALLLASGSPTVQTQLDQRSAEAAMDRTARQDWSEEIADAARRTGLSEDWIRQVMNAESAGVANAVSPKGAVGLMQVMPETYTEIAADSGLGLDPFNPRDNVLAGAIFLKRMLDRFGSPYFLAAYNAGPQCLDEVLAGLRPLPAESQAFMDKVALQLGLADGGSMLGSGGLARGNAALGGLFFVSRPGGFAAGQGTAGESIFVPLDSQKPRP